MNVDLADLKRMRVDIDMLDREIVELLKKRFKTSGLIGEMKQRERSKIEDREREREVLANYKAYAGGELDEGFIEELVKLILEHSREVQRACQKK